MKKLTENLNSRDFVKGLIIGLILGIIICPLKKGITINSYNEGNKNCQNAVHNQKKKHKKKRSRSQ